MLSKKAAKEWADTMENGLNKEIWMLCKQREWCIIVVNGGSLERGMLMQRSSRYETLNSTRCHSCELLLLYEALEGWKCLWPSLNFSA